MKLHTFSTRLILAFLVLVFVGISEGVIHAQAPTSIQVSPAPAARPLQPRPYPVSKVTLTAQASSASYYFGEPIQIDITLTNQGTTAVNLSNLVDSNIRVTSFSKNGFSVVPVPTTTLYDDGLTYALSNSLALVGRGGTRSITWTSTPNGKLGGDTLKTVTLGTTDNEPSDFYLVDGPGTYSVTFHYKYVGPSSDAVGLVHKTKTNSATVTFTVM